MSTVTGKLSQLILYGTQLPEAWVPELGSVEFSLCGYGSFNPRTTAGSSLGWVDETLNVEPDGTFAATLIGNDQIQPDGTYYTYTVRNANGDVIQCEAFRFVDSSDYDMNAAVPFNPNSPPPPIPPLLGNLLLPVAYDPNANFPGDAYPSWSITLTGDVTGATFTDLADGNLYTLVITQDGMGGHVFDAPANLLNFSGPDPAPFSITIQTFIAINNQLLATGPSTWYLP